MLAVNILDYSIAHHIDTTDGDEQLAIDEFTQLAEFLKLEGFENLAVSLCKGILKKSTAQRSKFKHLCITLADIRDGKRGIKDHTDLDSDNVVELARRLVFSLEILNMFTTGRQDSDQVVDEFLRFLTELRDGPQKSFYRNVMEKIKDLISWLITLFLNLLDGINRLIC